SLRTRIVLCRADRRNRAEAAGRSPPCDDERVDPDARRPRHDLPDSAGLGRMGCGSLPRRRGALLATLLQRSARAVRLEWIEAGRARGWLDRLGVSTLVDLVQSGFNSTRRGAVVLVVHC